MSCRPDVPVFGIPSQPSTSDPAELRASIDRLALGPIIAADFGEPECFSSVTSAFLHRSIIVRRATLLMESRCVVEIAIMNPETDAEKRPVQSVPPGSFSVGAGRINAIGVASRGEFGSKHANDASLFFSGTFASNDQEGQGDHRAGES